MLHDMPNYRRDWLPGGTWFFTVNLLERHGNDLLIREIDLLRVCVAHERARRPFEIVAWVVLPEHMHWIWRLPEGDTDYPTRWRRIKTDFRTVGWALCPPIWHYTTNASEFSLCSPRDHCSQRWANGNGGQAHPTRSSEMFEGCGASR